jgi:cytochrome c oxidase subunit 2
VDNYLQNVDQRLVLPVDTRIRFQITGADVIHSWWMPDLGWKKDAIPGYVNEMWTEIEEPGVYRGRCAELCGRDHGFMPIVVEALPKAEFETWLANRQASGEGMTAQAEAAPETDGELAAR